MFEDSGHTRRFNRKGKRPIGPEVTLPDLLDEIRNLCGMFETLIAGQREMRVEVAAVHELLEENR